jgi:hypothetical protein
MGSVRPDIPCIDETCTSRNVHERAEAVAVPSFDWVSMPVIAVMDGLMRIDPDVADASAAAADKH